MIVISDTSPVSYLVVLGMDWLLPAFFGEVVLPESVYLELASFLAPPAVQHWAANLPDWVRRRHLTKIPSDFLSDLDEGERAAIAPTVELQADLLLVHERKATTIAERQFGIHTTGTLGVLREAHLNGLIDGASALDRDLRQKPLFITLKVSSSSISALLRAKAAKRYLLN